MVDGWASECWSVRREKKLEPASSETGRSVTLERRKRRRGWKGREREEAREVGGELWGGSRGLVFEVYISASGHQVRTWIRTILARASGVKTRQTGGLKARRRVASRLGTEAQEAGQSSRSAPANRSALITDPPLSFLHAPRSPPILVATFSAGDSCLLI